MQIGTRTILCQKSDCGYTEGGNNNGGNKDKGSGAVETVMLFIVTFIFFLF